MPRRVALAVLVLAAATPAFPAPRLVEPISLVWVDPTAQAFLAADDAMEEAATLLRAAGTEVRWRRSGPALLLEENELAVIVLPSPRKTDRLVLGSTELTSTAPVVWIHPEAVAQTLGLDGVPPVEWTLREREGFGQALGRVAAHEVVHAVLGSSRHASIGLMSRSLVRASLLSPSLPVDPGTRRALRRALADPRRWTSR